MLLDQHLTVIVSAGLVALFAPSDNARPRRSSPPPLMTARRARNARPARHRRHCIRSSSSLRLQLCLLRWPQYIGVPLATLASVAAATHRSAVFAHIPRERGEAIAPASVGFLAGPSACTGQYVAPTKRRSSKPRCRCAADAINAIARGKFVLAPLAVAAIAALSINPPETPRAHPLGGWNISFRKEWFHFQIMLSACCDATPARLLGTRREIRPRARRALRPRRPKPCPEPVCANTQPAVGKPHLRGGCSDRAAAHDVPSRSVMNRRSARERRFCRVPQGAHVIWDASSGHGGTSIFTALSCGIRQRAKTCKETNPPLHQPEARRAPPQREMLHQRNGFRMRKVPSAGPELASAQRNLAVGSRSGMSNSSSPTSGTDFEACEIVAHVAKRVFAGPNSTSALRR